MLVRMTEAFLPYLMFSITKAPVILRMTNGHPYGNMDLLRVRMIFCGGIAYIDVGTSIARPYDRNISFLSHAFDYKNAHHSADDQWSSLRKHGFASRLNDILWRNRVHRRRDEHCSSAWQRRCVPIYGFSIQETPVILGTSDTRAQVPYPTEA